MKLKLNSTAHCEYVGSNNVCEYILNDYGWFTYIFKAKARQEDESFGMITEKTYDTVGIYNVKNITAVVVGYDNKHLEYYVEISISGCSNDCILWVSSKQEALDIQSEFNRWIQTNSKS